jgi:Trypsin
MKNKIFIDLLFVMIIVICTFIGFCIFFPFNRLFKKEEVSSKYESDKYGSIVRLVRDDFTFCSGTVVSNSLIITAGHCVSEQSPLGYTTITTDTIEIRPSENKDLKITAKVVNVSFQMDQALLTGDFIKFNTRQFYSKPEYLSKYLIFGQEFVSCGYPRGGDLYCTTTTFVEPEDFFWSVSGVLLPGMSGGPTMVNGIVVAVNTGVHREYSVISPIYNIMELLKK